MTRDPTHWLYRLTSEEWLAAAATELTHADAAFARRAIRPAVTHARRAAGMAWNAVLAETPDERYGRSYMDHLRALCDDPVAPDDVRAAAVVLCETPPAAPELIKLGPPDRRVVEAARAICAHARAAIQSAGTPA